MILLVTNAIGLRDRAVLETFPTSFACPSYACQMNKGNSTIVSGIGWLYLCLLHRIDFNWQGYPVYVKTAF